MINKILKLSFGALLVFGTSCDELADIFGEQMLGDWEVSSAMYYANVDCGASGNTGLNLIDEILDVEDGVEFVQDSLDIYVPVVPPAGVDVAYEVSFTEDPNDSTITYVDMSLGLELASEFDVFPIYSDFFIDFNNNGINDLEDQCLGYGGSVVDRDGVDWCSMPMTQSLCESGGGGDSPMTPVWNDSTMSCFLGQFSVQGTYEVTADEVCMEYSLTGGELPHWLPTSGCFGYEVSGTSLQLTLTDSTASIVPDGVCLQLSFSKLADSAE